MLSGTTTPGQGRPGSVGIEELFHIPQNLIAGVSPSACLVSYPGHMSRDSKASLEMLSMYSTAPANWAEV